MDHKSEFFLCNGITIVLSEKNEITLIFLYLIDNLGQAIKAIEHKKFIAQHYMNIFIYQMF